MTKQNQIIAIEKTVKTDAEKAFTAAYQMLDQETRFSGIARTYSPINDDDPNAFQYPDESTLVQMTVPELISAVEVKLVRMIDVVTTKDSTNTLAKADIKVGDTVLATDVPVTTMLWLEKQLQDMRTFLSKLPMLDPGKEWTWDDQTGNYVSDPVDTVKTQKVLQNHVKYEATIEHAAQVETFTKDEPVGKWTTRQFSGAIPRATRDALMDRLTNLQESVKMAREEANNTEVTDHKIAEGILDYLFEPVTILQ